MPPDVKLGDHGWSWMVSFPPTVPAANSGPLVKISASLKIQADTYEDLDVYVWYSIWQFVKRKLTCISVRVLFGLLRIFVVAYHKGMCLSLDLWFPFFFVSAWTNIAHYSKTNNKRVFIHLIMLGSIHVPFYTWYVLCLFLFAVYSVVQMFKDRGEITIKKP